MRPMPRWSLVERILTWTAVRRGRRGGATTVRRRCDGDGAAMGEVTRLASRLSR